MTNLVKALIVPIAFNHLSIIAIGVAKKMTLTLKTFCYRTKICYRRFMLLNQNESSNSKSLYRDKEVAMFCQCFRTLSNFFRFLTMFLFRGSMQGQFSKLNILDYMK